MELLILIWWAQPTYPNNEVKPLSHTDQDGVQNEVSAQTCIDTLSILINHLLILIKWTSLGFREFLVQLVNNHTYT